MEDGRPDDGYYLVVPEMPNGPGLENCSGNVTAVVSGHTPAGSVKTLN